jgi:hypothetical protein
MSTDQSPSQQVVSPGGGVRKILGAAARFARVQGGQSSTWRGLALLASACGIYLQPEMVAAITAVGMAVSGLIGVLLPDAPAGE